MCKSFEDIFMDESDCISVEEALEKAKKKYKDQL